MNSLTKVVVFSLLLILVGFTAVNEIAPSPEPKIEEVTPAVDEANSAATTIVNFVDKGEMKVSWYGPRFHGRKTANGEIFDQEAFTAAHKTLRFGTLLRVTNPKNNISIIVRINDRGPFIRGRHLDLSKAAARELGLIDIGIAKVDVDLVSLKGVNFPVIPFN